MSEQRLIDGTKVTKDIMKYSRDLHETGNTDAAGYVMWAASIVDIQPTIDPVRHGKWINGEYDDLYCSECGFEINYDGDYPTEYDNFKFCGCCGAKMDKEVAERELMQDIDKETKEAIWGNGNIEEPMMDYSQ